MDDDAAPDETRLEEPARQEIAALMAGPVKSLPSVVVVGDEAVFGLWPPSEAA